MLITGGAALIAVVAYLAFAVFGVHTLFIDEEVSEADPFATTTVHTDEAMEDEAMEDEPDEAMADDAMADEAMADDAMADDAMEEDAMEDEPEIVTVTSGSFVDGDHPTSGIGFTITDGSQTFLRFEEFQTDNGPDLNVYLRSSDDPEDYIDLGDLKGNIGEQNYELPQGTDLDRYDLVDIWCVRFGSSFGSAQLAPA